MHLEYIHRFIHSLTNDLLLSDVSTNLNDGLNPVEARAGFAGSVGRPCCCWCLFHRPCPRCQPSWWPSSSLSRCWLGSWAALRSQLVCGLQLLNIDSRAVTLLGKVLSDTNTLNGPIFMHISTQILRKLNQAGQQICVCNFRYYSDL